MNNLNFFFWLLFKLSQKKCEVLYRKENSTSHFLQEQLQKKTKFNFIKFDAEPVAWKNKLAEVNERNLEDALHWVRNLQVNMGGGEWKKMLLLLLDFLRCISVFGSKWCLLIVGILEGTSGK